MHPLTGDWSARCSETREFETFLGDLERLRDWLAAEGVSHVAMEATGVYWKPVWFALEELDVELLLVNSRNMRMVPAARPMSPTRHGSRSCWRSGCCGAASCRHR